MTLLKSEREQIELQEGEESLEKKLIQKHWQNVCKRTSGTSRDEVLGKEKEENKKISEQEAFNLSAETKL